MNHVYCFIMRNDGKGKKNEEEKEEELRVN